MKSEATKRTWVPAFGTYGWLYLLRWFAVIGQLLTIAGAWMLYGFELPFLSLVGLIGVTAATNTAYGFWLVRKQSETDEPLRRKVAALIMVSDLIVLAGMLYLTGGSGNPFAAFFLVNLAVACIILPPAWAGTLTALAMVCYAWLTYNHQPLMFFELGEINEASRAVRLQGRIAAFSACAVVVTYFVTQLAHELTERQRVLREVQQQRDRSQRLEALATLAAGAAHELASPLSTIAIVAREMSHRLETIDPEGEIRRDVRLIDGELENCRQILSRMRSSAGDASAESWGRATLGDLVDAIVEGVREPNRIDVEIAVEDEATPLWLPVQTVAQVVRNLLHNGLDASHATCSVHLKASADAEVCRLEVRDQGCGMSEDVLRRIGEPFFTTKPPGRGMGLGLFLTRNVVQRLGGNLQIESQPGTGTTMTITLPRSCTPLADSSSRT